MTSVFAKNLKNKRLERGLSQKQVATYLHVSPQSVSKWEKGIAEPSIAYLPLLAEYLQCEIGEFFVKGQEDLVDSEALAELLALENKAAHFEMDPEEVAEYVADHEAEFKILEEILDRISCYKTVNVKTVCAMLCCSAERARGILSSLEGVDAVVKLDIADNYYVSAGEICELKKMMWTQMLLYRAIEHKRQGASIINGEGDELQVILEGCGMSKEKMQGAKKD